LGCLQGVTKAHVTLAVYAIQRVVSTSVFVGGWEKEFTAKDAEAILVFALRSVW